MYRSIKADKDAYITDRIVRGAARTDANTGFAGTLDLQKVYGLNKTGSASLNELSRLLIHFDLTSLRADLAAGAFDLTSPTFRAHLKLHDVYGGQTTPRNFSVRVYPLSRSWEEGRGKDVVYYQDSDQANFLTASWSSGAPSTWFASGANAKGLLGSADIDLVASGNLGAGVVPLSVTQSFVLGTEDLDVDVTTILSATLRNLLPDEGFRVSFDEAAEEDLKTRFVKRFGSRQAVDPRVRPELIVRYDDSVISHQSGFVFDASGSVFLSKTVRGTPANLVSGSALTPIAGNGCLLLKLWTNYSSSVGYQQYAQYVTASQHSVGGIGATGVYSATFAIPSSDSRLTALIANAQASGSNAPVVFNEVWTSLDGTVAYASASLEVRTVEATVASSIRPKRYQVNVVNVADEYAPDDVVRLRCNVSDRSSPLHRSTRVPQEEPSLILEAYYSVRDVQDDATVIPFDRTYGSTRLSVDASSMYLDVWTESLVPGRSYVVDIMIVDGGRDEVYYSASPAFRVGTSPLSDG